MRTFKPVEGVDRVQFIARGERIMVDGSGFSVEDDDPLAPLLAAHPRLTEGKGKGKKKDEAAETEETVDETVDEAPAETPADAGDQPEPDSGD